MRHQDDRRRREWDVLARLNRATSGKIGRDAEMGLSGLEPRVMYTGASDGTIDDPDADFPAVYDDVATQQVVDEQQAAAGSVKIPVQGGVPIYHSNPNATVKIILDFDGDGARTWGSYSVPGTPAYDQDGDPTTFSTAELASINEICMRVSEKYSPFNVDVTTEDTTGGVYANQVDVHVVIGGNGAWLGQTTGGIAYIGGFYNSADNTAFVFPGNLATGTPKYVGEACAHEAGHTFGLQHQSVWSGTTMTQQYNPGNSLTAPIMGNSYYAARGLWWSGTSSVSSTSTQTDLSILSGANNGFGYRADDYGSTTQTARGLALSNNTFTVSGVIEQTTDKDYFSFTMPAGQVTLTLSVAQYAAMLDGSLFVYDSGGNLVSSADTTSLGESLTLSLSAGTYYVAAGSHGGYGDIGQYTLAGTVVPTTTTVADPSAITATGVSASRVTVAWTDNSGNESGFTIDRSTDGGNTWVTVGSVGANVTTYNDNTVGANTQYWYRVQAYNASTTSGYTATASVTTPPATPSAVGASATSATQVTVTWGDVGGETGFLVERSTDNTNWAQVGTTAQGVTTYTDGGLSAGVTYYYRVRAVGTGGNSAYSSTASTVTVPATPANLAAVANSATQVTVSWSAVTGAASYAVERSADGVNWSALGTSVTAGYTDTTVSAATTYYYRVRAVNGSGSSAFTAGASVLTVPAAPTLSGVVATSATQITATWSAVSGASSYSVDRSLDGVNWSALGTTAGTSYDDATASAGTRYYYRVRAANGAGKSAYSGSLSALTFPAAPATLTATAVSATQVGLAWPAAAGASTYSVERSLDGVNWTVLVASTAATSYNDTTATAGTSYTYRVRATNASGTSGYSTATGLTMPAAPGTIGVAVTTSRVTLSWSAVTGATSYSVERSTDGVNWTVAGSPATAGFTESGLAAGTSYSYRVRAVNASGNSAYSATVAALTLPGAPTISALAATSTTQMSVTWGAMTGATSYVVERSTDNANWGQVSSGTATSFADSGLSAGTRYYYRVRALNASGASANSTAGNAITLPAAPGSLAVSAAGATQLTLSWTAVTGAASYGVERSSDGVNWSAIGTAAAGATYDDSGLLANTHYFYRVRAVNASGNSAYSATLDALTTTAAPATTTASPVSATEVSVNWSAVTGATSYSVERSTDGVNWGVVTTTASTSFDDTSAAAGTSYSYRVRAVNGGGASAYGPTAAALTMPAAPAALNVTVVSGSEVTLSWSAVAGAASYGVERSTDGVNWTVIGTPPGTSLDDATLAVGVTYYFRVRAVNATGGSAYVTATNVLTPPTAPAGLAETGVGAGGLTVTWTATSGATVYTVERSADGVSGWTVIGTTGTGGTALADANLSAGTHYFYRVTAANPSGSSAASAVLDAVTLPGAPSVYSINAGVAGQVSLSWMTSMGADSYVVERQAAGGGWVVVGTPTAPMFVDSGVASGTAYSYRVHGVNAGGASADSLVASALTLPGAPANVSASGQSMTQVSVSWDAVTGAAFYRVERTTDGVNWVVVSASVAGTSLVDDSLAAGTSYTYRVAAVNATGTSDYSDELGVMTLPECPAPLVASTSQQAVVELMWMPVVGAESYEVERAAAGTGQWALIATVTDAAYADADVAAGVSYSYRVRAVNDGGASAYTSIATATPPVVMNAPTGLAAGTPTSSGVTVTWQDNSDNEQGFRVQRSADGGLTWLTVAETTADVTSFDDSGLAGGTAYAYRVQAFNGAFDSGFSDEASVVTKPAAPTSLHATGRTVSRLTLAWGTSAGATAYEVERSDDGVSGWTSVASVTGGQFTETGLVGGAKHYYRVRAVNGSGDSGYSAVVAGVTLPSAPSSLVALATPEGPVSLGWSAVEGTTGGYVVERSTDNANWSQLVTTGGVFYSDATAQAGVTYFYRATAIGEAGASAYSPVAGATTFPGAPGAVTSVAVSASQVRVGWGVVAGAQSYVIERSDDGGASWAGVGMASVNWFDDSALSPNSTYLYRVYAVNEAGTSGASGAATATTLQAAPGAPSAMTVTPVSANTLLVGWTRGSSNEAGFRVEYSADGRTWKLAGNVAAGTTSVQVTGLITGDNYRFRVSAYNEMGLSPSGGVISGKAIGGKAGTQPGTRVLDVKNVKASVPGLRKGLAPDAATGLAVRAYSTSAVQLTWKDNADNELGYRVEYSIDGRNWLLAGYTTAKQTGCRVTNLQKGHAYAFRVVAYNFAGDGKRSGAAKVTVPTKAPTGPAARPSTDPDQDTALNVLKVSRTVPGLGMNAA